MKELAGLERVLKNRERSAAVARCPLCPESQTFNRVLDASAVDRLRTRALQHASGHGPLQRLDYLSAQSRFAEVCYVLEVSERLWRHAEGRGVSGGEPWRSTAEAGLIMPMACTRSFAQWVEALARGSGADQCRLRVIDAVITRPPPLELMVTLCFRLRVTIFISAVKALLSM